MSTEHAMWLENGRSRSYVWLGYTLRLGHSYALNGDRVFASLSISLHNERDVEQFEITSTSR